VLTAELVTRTRESGALLIRFIHISPQVPCHVSKKVTSAGMMLGIELVNIACESGRGSSCPTLRLLQELTNSDQEVSKIRHMGIIMFHERAVWSDGEEGISEVQPSIM